MMWVWLLALAGTVAAFALAWRGLVRAEGALGALRAQVAADDGIDGARARLDATTAESASGRHALLSRSVASPS